MIAHLLPELLNLYGDRGNVLALAQRARWRGAEVTVVAIDEEDASQLSSADIVFIGGGPDRQQVAAARALVGLGSALDDALAGGAALIAVCGGYQSLGHWYRSPLVGELAGPAILDVRTDAPRGANRLVGGVVVDLEPGSPIRAAGAASAAAAGFAGQESTVVGFENHSGRTFLGPDAHSIGTVRRGHGNNGMDGGEGLLSLPGHDRRAGLRIGTYLHGPLLPRNPHLTDLILGSVLARHGVGELAPLPDEAEWSAHAAFAARWLAEPGDGSRDAAAGPTVSSREGNVSG